MPPAREYKFVTVWKTDAPLEKVWNEIYHSERWPEWWRGVEEVVEICLQRAEPVEHRDVLRGLADQHLGEGARAQEVMRPARTGARIG